MERREGKEGGKEGRKEGGKEGGIIRSVGTAEGGRERRGRRQCEVCLDETSIRYLSNRSKIQT